MCRLDHFRKIVSSGEVKKESLILHGASFDDGDLVLSFIRLK